LRKDVNQVRTSMSYCKPTYAVVSPEGPGFSIEVAPIIAMQLSTARKLMLKVRIFLRSIVSHVRRSTYEMAGARRTYQS
jgi:hypothetical protein